MRNQRFERKISCRQLSWLEVGLTFHSHSYVSFQETGLFFQQIMESQPFEFSTEKFRLHTKKKTTRVSILVERLETSRIGKEEKEKRFLSKKKIKNYQPVYQHRLPSDTLFLTLYTCLSQFQTFEECLINGVEPGEAAAHLTIFCAQARS